MHNRLQIWQFCTTCSLKKATWPISFFFKLIIFFEKACKKIIFDFSLDPSSTFIIKKVDMENGVHLSFCHIFNLSKFKRENRIHNWIQTMQCRCSNRFINGKVAYSSNNYVVSNFLWLLLTTSLRTLSQIFPDFIKILHYNKPNSINCDVPECPDIQFIVSRNTGSPFLLNLSFFKLSESEGYDCVTVVFPGA